MHRDEHSTQPFNRPRRGLLLSSALSALLALSLGALAPAAPAQEQPWIASWGAAPAGVAPDQLENLDGQTMRLIVRTSVPGQEVRIKLSNEFGAEPLRIGAARVALRAGGAAFAPGSERVLTFEGEPAVTVPAGAAVYSDPVALEVKALAQLAVSLHFPAEVKASTVHRNAFQTSYLSFPGNFVGISNFPTARTITSWPFLTEVDVRPAAGRRTVVAFGDSITDGSATTVDANRRWPDLLAQRLHGPAAAKDGPRLGIVNRGIGGNRLLRDAAYAPFGKAGLARFERDVLGTPGVSHVVVLIGINDLGHPGHNAPASEAPTAQELIDGYRQLIARARAKGVKVIGATLTPFEGTTFAGFYSAEKEELRQAVNGWIRSGGEFDGAIDFDQVLRDPARPARLLAAFDSGDHLHPNDAGMRALADAVPLGLFEAKPAAKGKRRRATK